MRADRCFAPLSDGSRESQNVSGAYQPRSLRLAVKNAPERYRRLGRNLDRITGFFFFPTFGERLDECHEVGAGRQGS